MNSAATSPIFSVEGKALTAHELRSGDVEIAGYAAVWDGLDADSENFLRGSFANAIPRALAAGLPVAYHHDTGRILGHVLDMYEDDRGVRIRARIDKQTPGSPLFHIYDGVRRGSLRGLSAAGYFQRAASAAGAMIANVLRLTEISVTGVPSHPLTGLDAVEVKALGLDAERERLEGLFAAECGRLLDLAHVRLSAADVRLTARGL